ncbi:uncharacterized protein VNE69_06104 [Vairimorpha necatrix]|uniref:Retrotransposon gag domain-containing protein n=1 Tax=Vairimorpha necatrix TaxID=6039 RepID=A0AAX4JCR2_9MICR
MSDEQKSEFIISRACPEIIDWYCNHKQRKAAFNWSRWKEELEEFCSPNKLDIGYVFRLKQKPAETICEYIKLVDEAARVHKLNNEDIIKIILAGMKDEIPDVKRIIIRSKVVDEVLFSDIRLLEGTYQAEKLKKEERRKIKKEKKELEKKELELKKEEIRELRRY